MKRILIALVAVLLCLGPVVADDSERSGKKDSDGQGLKASDLDRLEVIPRTVIVERIASEGEASFSSNLVLFDYGSWKLKDASHKQLLELAAALKDRSLREVPVFFVDGHTCDIGTETNNCTLAWRRALSVINFLVSAGEIPPERLAPRGFGPFDPVKSNKSEEGRKQNRRVVVKKGPVQDEDERENLCPPVKRSVQ